MGKSELQQAIRYLEDALCDIGQIQTLYDEDLFGKLEAMVRLITSTISGLKHRLEVGDKPPADAERRCGTCWWWGLEDDGDNKYRYCQFAPILPEAFSAEAEMVCADEGVNCPCWKVRGK
jgi:hypothetical protein